MIKPVKHLHGLSPVEDWIQHSQYVEQQRDALTAENDRLKKEVEALNNRYAVMFKRARQIEGDDFDIIKNYPTGLWWFNSIAYYNTPLEAYEAFAALEGDSQ